MKDIRKIMVTSMAALLSVAVFGAITGTITSETGDVQKGVIRWSARDKAYAISKGNTEIQFKPSEIAEMVIDKPAGYDAAVAQVEKGKGNAAIPVLQKIVKEYQRLQYDKFAGRYLAEAYVQAGKANDGLRACEDIIKTDSSAAYKGDLAPAYWNALFALGRKAKVEDLITKALKSGDEFSMASALVMRGDIIYKDGSESNDAAKKALVDGYLRTVFMYEDSECAPKVRPEALCKAARCFDKLGQSGRADAMRSEIKRNYPTSPWVNR